MATKSEQPRAGVKPRHANRKENVYHKGLARESAKKDFAHRTGEPGSVPEDIDDAAYYEVVLSEPIEFGNSEHQPGHGTLNLRGDMVKEFRASIVNAVKV